MVSCASISPQTWPGWCGRCAHAPCRVRAQQANERAAKWVAATRGSGCEHQQPSLIKSGRHDTPLGCSAGFTGSPAPWCAQCTALATRCSCGSCRTPGCDHAAHRCATAAVDRSETVTVSRRVLPPAEEVALLLLVAAESIGNEARHNVPCAAPCTQCMCC